MDVVLTKKSRQLKQNDGQVKDIKKWVPNNVFRLCKFILSDQQEKEMVEKYLDEGTDPNFKGNGKEAKSNRRTFIQYYRTVFTQRLNETRSYATARMKDAVWEWMNYHQGNLPDETKLLALLNRTWTPPEEDSDDYAEEWKLAVWYQEVYLCKACGNGNDWSSDKRRYLTISEGAPVNAPNSKYITPSTEAFAMVIFESNAEHWKKMYDLKKQYPELSIKTIKKT